MQVEIGRGENHGRTVTYHNVVRGWIKLGDWTGTKTSWTVPLSQIQADGVDAAAVMVQEGTHDKPGIILGAAYTAPAVTADILQPAGSGVTRLSVASASPPQSATVNKKAGDLPALRILGN